MRRIWLTTTLATALTGCAVGPNYHAPTLPVAPQFRAQPSAASSSAEPWWTMFHDVDLDALEARAMANNLTVEQALARVDQANAAFRHLGAAQLPAATVDGSLARSEQSINSGLGQLSKYVPSLSRTVDNGQLGINAGWDLDFAGGLKRQHEATKADAVAAQAGVDAARLGVAAELADAYIVYRGTQAQRDSYQKLDAMLRDQRVIMAVRVKVGAAPRQALDLATAREADTAATLPNLDAVIEAERNRIAVLVGQSPSLDVPELAHTATLPHAEGFGTGVPADLLRQRPDLVIAEQALIASNAKIGAALSEYYPKLSLSALLGFNSNALSTLISGDAAVLQGAAGLHWRLFDFARVNAEVKAARGKERESLAAYRDAVLRASEDVETGFSRLAAAQSRAAEIARKRAALSASLTTAQRAFTVGQISRDTQIDAARADVAAQAEQVAAETDTARAAIAARRALGH